ERSSHPGPRYAAADVPTLRYGVSFRVQSVRSGWEAVALRLMYTAVPYLVPPLDADALLGGEDPPREIMADLHLPFPAVAVFLAAEFHLTDLATKALPTWDPEDSSRRELSYEPWVAELGRVGGSLSG